MESFKARRICGEKNESSETASSLTKFSFVARKMASSTPHENADKLWEKIKGIELAMMTTVDARDGSLRSRPMATASKDLTDGNIWFFSKSDSMKMGDVGKTEKVNLTYVRPSSSTFVSICGSADVVHDKVLSKKLWSPLMEAFFKKGSDDPELALIRVRVDRAETWEINEGLMEYISHALVSKTVDEVTSHAHHEEFKLSEQPS